MEASKICDFHSLLLEVYLSKKGNSKIRDNETIEVLRDGSSMMITGMDTPALSICRTPGMSGNCKEAVVTD